MTGCDKNSALTLASLVLCLGFAACGQDMDAADVAQIKQTAIGNGDEHTRAVTEALPDILSADNHSDPDPAPARTRNIPDPTRTPLALGQIPTPSPVAARPDPTPTPGLHDEETAWGHCGPFYYEFHRELGKYYLDWTVDGADIVFKEIDDSTLSAIDTEGTLLQTIANANPGYLMPYGFHFDVSPDGSQVVYSSCEYRTERGLDQDVPEGFDPPEDRRPEREKHNYEIVTVAIDGTSPKRLTQNEYLDHFPEWSPDGTRIAFVGEIRIPEGGFYPRNAKLLTMAADGSGVPKALTPPQMEVGLYPPMWSPDGEMVAFIAIEGESYPFSNILYTVGADGSGLTRIGETETPPTWSPGGEYLAFARAEEMGSAIYTIRPDGTGIREIWRGVPYGAFRPSTSIYHVSWSPEGSELLFVSSDGTYVVEVDGDGLRRLSLPKPAILNRLHRAVDTQAVWSPDGSRIAIYFPVPVSRSYPEALILTMTRDGEDVRMLARADDEGKLRAWNAPRPERLVDLALCSEDLVVPEPDANPGLVGDCETLLTIRDEFAGIPGLGWWTSWTPISKWEGVTTGGVPPRVHELRLQYRGLTGRLPPQIAELTELKLLDLSYNELVGPIPAELGALTELEHLDLGWNFLSGSIPVELDSLAHLEVLDLSWNFLSGNIPRELGTLANLRWLYLNHNSLDGEIPPELGNLSQLTKLDISMNILGGAIPQELVGLESLRELRVLPNYLTKCIVAEQAKTRAEIRIGHVWVERCDSAGMDTP